MILGLDISTSITGVTVLSDDGDVLLNEAVLLKNAKTFFEKCNIMRAKLQEIENDYQILNVFIEETLQAFRPGYSSAKTILKLAKFNGIVSWMCYDIFCLEPDYIPATSARKLCGITVPKGKKGKEAVLEYMLDKQDWFVVEYTKFDNVRAEYYDMADSWVVAQAGFNKCHNKNK